MDISEESTEPDRKSSDTSEDDESEMGDSVSYFENITDLNRVIYPDLNKEDSEVGHFLTEEILEIIRDQSNLYATLERETTWRAGSDDGQL
jgi:hypothetical protein